MLQPRKVKHRKHHRGRMNGVSKGATELAFGEYGIQALEPGWITARQIEAKGRQGHDQVLVDQKADQFPIRFAQAENLGGLIGDAQPYFGVIFNEAFSEIVQEQGQVQDEFLFGFPVEFT